MSRADMALTEWKKLLFIMAYRYKNPSEAAFGQKLDYYGRKVLIFMLHLFLLKKVSLAMSHIKSKFSY